MKKTIFSLVIITLVISTSIAQPQKWKKSKYMTIVSYNVENLFDTIDNPHKKDNEFTPNSYKKWNSKRYYKKIHNIASVIASINPKELPEIVGLVEVENASVLNDLINTKQLKKAKYNFVIDNGPDIRGINCALLYKPKVFNKLSEKFIPVKYNDSRKSKTRNILYVKGTVKTDTVHIFVNHWSSRVGGREKSEYKRVTAANILKKETDSILQINPQSNIIVIGDFNDQPNNKSLHHTLKAGQLTENTILLNLTYPQFLNKKQGTYYYRGEYNTLDNFIINRKTLKTKTGFRPYEAKAFIFHPDKICYTSRNGDKAPSRSYKGKYYYGGYSDHFPIFSIFYEK